MKNSHLVSFFRLENRRLLVYLTEPGGARTLARVRLNFKNLCDAKALMPNDRIRVSKRIFGVLSVYLRR